MFWHPSFNIEYVTHLRNNGRVIIRCKNKVYDFTDYLENHIHPGTNEIIKRFSDENKDCFDDYIFHRTSAHKMWKIHFIGFIITH
jgi:cytochrome b involved in lipid metabolism